MKRTTFTAEAGKQEVVITRNFDATRESLFEAFTDPRLIIQWWGPENLTTLIDKLDPSPGGLWRFIQSDSAGTMYTFHGVYHEVACPERLVYTFEFEGAPGHALLEIITFEGQNGRTRLTDKSVFQSVEDRDGMLAAGMEAGSTESMDRLARLMGKLATIYP
jgi:uncharacterized protein YndB with AHSA1/START domain